MTSPELLEAASRLLPSGAGVAGKLYARAFATGRLEPEAVGVSAASARAWREAFAVGLLEVRSVAREEGDLGVTVKVVLATKDGELVECVRVPVPTASGAVRSTICISSQIGCRMGCSFCESGRRGLVRNLRAAEIVAQVVTARSVLGWECRNVVFMGMGEPLDNFDSVAGALGVLADNRGLRYSWERITVCTSGDAAGIARLRELGLKRLNLSISLNAADDDTRSALMPVNRLTDLSTLAVALAAYPQRRGFVLGVNYCLLPGINDTRGHARGVAEYCRRLGRTQLNLIPYNPGTTAIARAPAAEETERFRAWLTEAGVDTKVRAARGSSIMAGCGQLGGASAGTRCIPRKTLPCPGPG
jgi:23S rRNA (adenine2503-C2)-methyltransferase